MKVIQKVSKKKIVLGFTLFMSFAVLSCGRNTESEPQTTEIDSFGLNGEATYLNRFSQSDIDTVYSDKVRDGVPVNNPFLTELFTSPEQAPDLAAEFGDFSNAGEIKAYLNLNRSTGLLTKTRFILAIEAISLWKQILNSKGEKLFKETYSINTSGKEIADSIDGKLTNNEQLQFGRLKMQVSIATITADMKVFLKDHGDYLSLDMVNVREIKAPFVGTVIKTNGFRIHLELYPYKNGYLTYGVTTAKLEQLADKLTPELLTTQVTSIFNWLQGKLTGK